MFVKVVNDPAPPVLTSFSIQPVPPDSAKVGAADPQAISYDLQHLVRATDANGAPIVNVLTEFRSTDPLVAVVEKYGWLSSTPANPLLRGIKRDTVTILARTNLFGIVMADSVRFEVTWTIAAIVSLNLSVDGTIAVNLPSVRLARYGIVGWQNPTSSAVDITFADPTHVAAASTSTLPDDMSGATLCLYMQYSANADCTLSGNFTSPPGANGFPVSYMFRVFPEPGTYEYQVGQGARAKIIVE